MAAADTSQPGDPSNQAQSPENTEFKKSDDAKAEQLAASGNKEAVLGRSFAVGKPFAQMFFDAYGEAGGRVHAETVIGAAAAMAGEFALRVSAPASTLERPQGWVVDRAVDRLLYSGESSGELTIWSLIKVAVSDRGQAPLNDVSIEDIVRRNDAQIGKSPYPPLSIPPKHFPREWSPNATIRLRQKVFAIAASHGLSPHETALALGWALFEILRQARSSGIEPRVAATLAAEIMIGVSRMIPLKTSY